MILLAIETSGPVGSVALSSDDTVLAEVQVDAGMVHGRELVPMLEKVLRAAGRNTSSVDVIAVSMGPGSYTGLRVGVSCAKTLAYALSRPVVGVSSLEVIAYNAPPTRRLVWTVVDARRRHLYVAGFVRSDAGLLRTYDDAAIEFHRLPEILPVAAFVIGDAIKAYPDLLKASPALELAPPELWVPRAAVVALLAFRRASRGQYDDPIALVPVYLQIPEAEVLWQKRHGAGRG